ncbi:hypothetical protein SBA3_660004 [Candidatus Sulfopaludibacter sp. SbA3]|nr:hypothetical protein SBA3_660004 [Candidatus Sulfopaludibacter sp. SbA3]
MLLKISLFVGNRGGAVMKGFDGTSGRLAVFLAALTLGMLMPTRMAFAQG